MNIPPEGSPQPGAQKRRALPPRYFGAALAASAVLAYVVPGPQIIPYPWTLLGLVPLLLGGGLNVVADRQFKNVGTTVKPFETSCRLITDGVYGVSRNPMYLGMVSILAGAAILLGVLTPCFVVPLFAVVIQRVFIRPEEQMLEEQFPQEWRTYAGRVRQWI
jgi:protein-S-isoprenylcysteine O-methyltransferase Ste14